MQKTSSPHHLHIYGCYYCNCHHLAFTQLPQMDFKVKLTQRLASITMAPTRIAIFCLFWLHAYWPLHKHEKKPKKKHQPTAVNAFNFLHNPTANYACSLWFAWEGVEKYMPCTSFIHHYFFSSFLPSSPPPLPLLQHLPLSFLLEHNVEWAGRTPFGTWYLIVNAEHKIMFYMLHVCLAFFLLTRFPWCILIHREVIQYYSQGQTISLGASLNMNWNTKRPRRSLWKQSTLFWTLIMTLKSHSQQLVHLSLCLSSSWKAHKISIVDAMNTCIMPFRKGEKSQYHGLN